MLVTEQTVIDELKRKKWTVYRNGWPDLLIVKGTLIKCVEIKSKGQRLTKHQAVIHSLLKKAGVDVSTVFTPPIDSATRRTVYRMLENGSTYTEIAAAVGCSRQRVGQFAQEIGKRSFRSGGAPTRVTVPTAIRFTEEERHIVEVLSDKLGVHGAEIIRRAIRDLGSAYEISYTDRT